MINAIVFALKNWKIIVSSVTALVMGFAIAWWIQGVRLHYTKSEIANLRSQIERCQDANKTNQETISALQSELKKSQSLCNLRLKAKDKVINRLKDIDALKGKSEVENEKGIDATAVDDTILHELNRMFVNIKSDSKD